MTIYQDIIDLIYKYKYLGFEHTENGTILIGKAPFLGDNAWLNKIYNPLDEKDLNELEFNLKRSIPDDYNFYLKNISNGLNILSSTLSLYGFRKLARRTINAYRQPFSIITPNIYERPDNSKDCYFYIGGYNWDGSHIYIDTLTGYVHYCKRWDSTSLFQWSSLHEMIYSEIKRIYILFDENGKEIDENVSTLPI